VNGTADRRSTSNVITSRVSPVADAYTMFGDVRTLKRYFILLTDRQTDRMNSRTNDRKAPPAALAEL